MVELAMQKIVSTEGLEVGEDLVFRQARSRKNLTVLGVSEGVIHAIEDETGLEFNLDLSDKRRRWAVYRPDTLPGGGVVLPVEVRQALEEAQAAFDKLKAVVESQSPAVERDATPPVEHDPVLARKYKEMVAWAQEETNQYVANTEGGYARINPHAFKTWCMKNDVVPQELEMFAQQRGLLHLDGSGNHPKSNRSGNRMMKFTPELLG